ncbi:hypothetical protein DVW12_09745, partial [Clostridium botulinum]|nr:hypothetical protein [Clostridium botulinum]
MEQSKKIYFDDTLYIDLKNKDKNYIPKDNLIVGIDNTKSSHVYNSILKFNSNNWNFNTINSIHLFIFLKKINLKHSPDGNISILCSSNNIYDKDESLENTFFNHSSFKKINLTFPSKAMEHYIRIDITSIFSPIYSLNNTYNLILEPYFNLDTRGYDSLIEFLSSNSTKPPYLIVNGDLCENNEQNIVDFTKNNPDLLTELKDLNKNSLDKILTQLKNIENSNNNIITNSNNINNLLNSEITSKDEFLDVIKKIDSDKICTSDLNKNIISNNLLISSLSNDIKKHNSLISKFSEKLDKQDEYINSLNDKIKNINSFNSSLNESIKANTELINILSEQLNTHDTSVNSLNNDIKNNYSVISSLDDNIKS